MSEPDRQKAPAPPPALAVVIVNFNGCEVLMDCLASLRASTRRDFRVIVVDNASSDTSVVATRLYFPEAEVIPASTNLGFAAGNNAGMTRALETGAPLVLLLNNDTVVEATTIDDLVTSMDAHPEFAASSPKVCFFDRPDRVWFAGGGYSLFLGVPRHYGLRRRADAPALAVPRACTFLSGCALCIRADALRAAGPLREDFFMYAEDTEYSLRLRARGFQLGYVPAPRIFHREAWSTRRHASRRWGIRLCTRNLLMTHALYRKWYHLPTFLLYFTFRWVLVAGIAALFRREPSVLAGIADGILAYWHGETGSSLG